MSKPIENLFHGPLYMHEAFMLSCGAALYKSLVNVSYEEKTQTDLINECTSLSEYGNEASEVKNVAVITFNQPVIKYDYGYWLGTQTFIRILNRYKADTSVAAVVFNIDSGGGQVYGTPEFYDYIIDFRKTKPFVVYCGGLLCSGAFYIAAPADWIVVNKRADAIGSIGVYATIFDFNAFWEKHGAKIYTIYADESPEKNKAYRDVVEKGDLESYRKIELSPTVKEFHDDMKAARPQLDPKVFQGGTWRGSEAVELGLADEVGTLETAIAKAYELSEASDENQNSNSKIKKSMSTTKGFPKIQKVLGIEGDGLTIVKKISGKKGVFIEEAQLDALEADLVAQEKAVATAEEKATAAEEKLTEANAKVTAIDKAVNTALTDARLDEEADEEDTTEAKISLLGKKTVEYANKPGKKTSNPKSDGDKFEEDDDDEKSTSIYQSLKSK